MACRASLTRAAPLRLYAAEELAKYLEHREARPRPRAEIARRGADGAALARDARRAAFEPPLRRLERKLGGDETHWIPAIARRA